MTVDIDIEAAVRPVYPHLENLDRVIAHVPDFLSRGPVTITEKIHGFNARVGRDDRDRLWYGSRNQDFDLPAPGEETDGPSLQGFRDYAAEAFRTLPTGVTIYGEWAGKGVQKGIDYGVPQFYVFGERLGDKPVVGAASILDHRWLLGVETVPVFHEGDVPAMVLLDEWRRGDSILASGQPIEGIVISPVEPIFDVWGHQIIAKYKSPRFAELSHVRKEYKEPADLTVVQNLAAEYVNEGRFEHVLDQVREALRVKNDGTLHEPWQLDPLDPRHTGDVLREMYQDVLREGADDVTSLSDEDKKRLGKTLNFPTLALLKAARERDLAEQQKEYA